ncbi:sigma-70 family RNA polymerase sigma factor [Bosea sp. FBZP-16]|uniref:sigma-70 family RNA polymerase sigma factor n=1 Tax=Bosea sp. FBZP-16 TaxID=2065382 RepID=UPI000C315658|nr:sigma-70 family RNA polymerase sigma factor [Bosea sp. FBZP-16]
MAIFVSAQPANDNRPASFDQAMLAYLPSLANLAKKLRPTASRQDREDLVQATLCKAFETWRSYRTDKSPYTWLRFIMRSQSRDDLERRQKAADFKLRLPGVSVTITEPNQEHAADLALVADQIAPDLREDMLDMAAGALLAEPAARRGITRERARQMFERERERLASLARRADTRRDVVCGRAA